MKEIAIQTAIDITERGWVPDSWIRKGIDSLCEARLKELSANNKATHQNDVSAFVADLKKSPIALLTEKANEQHYEVPAAFFLNSLGTNLKYSSCYWTDNTTSLDEAEEVALDHTMRNAELSDGMRILELGCGWGSLTLAMAARFPNAQITAVSNSSSQKVFIEGKAKARGLNNIHIITSDMNDFETADTFDRIVSVEMFEHMRNYEKLFARISNWLTKQGKLLVHVFCHKDTPYAFETEGADNWMGKYFFSGGIMPSEDLFEHFSRDLRIEKKWHWNGMHYAKTANAWLEKIDLQRETVMPILEKTYGQDAKRWLQRWRMFFMACAQLFGHADGQEWYVTHYRFSRA